MLTPFKSREVPTLIKYPRLLPYTDLVIECIVFNNSVRKSRPLRGVRLAVVEYYPRVWPENSFRLVKQGPVAWDLRRTVHNMLDNNFALTLVVDGMALI